MPATNSITTPIARLIVVMLRLSPEPMTYLRLCEQTGATPLTVQRYLRNLHRAGLVRRIRTGHQFVYELIEQPDPTDAVK